MTHSPWETAGRVAAGLFWSAAILTVLAGALYAGRAIIMTAPTGWLVDETVVTLASEAPGPVEISWPVVGRRETEAGRPAFGLRRLGDGGWSLLPPPGATVAMIAPRRQRLDALLLAKGMRLRIDADDLAVAEADAGRLVIEDRTAGRRLEMTGDGAGADRVTMTPPPPLATCRVDRLLAGWPAWMLELDDWRRRQRIVLSEPQLTLGGAVDCPVRWALPSLSSGALGLARANGGWALVPLGADAERMTVATPGRPAAPAFTGRPIRLPLDLALPDKPLLVAIDRLVLAVAAEGDRLRLTPQSGRQRLDWPPIADDPRVSVTDRAAPWIGSPGDDRPTDERLQRLGGLGVVGAALLATVAAAALLRNARTAVAASGLAALATMAGLVAAGLVAAGPTGAERAVPQPPVALWGCLAAAAWAWTVLVLAVGGWLRGAGGPFCLFATLAVAAGCLTQLQLAAGGVEETRLWLPAGQCQGVVATAIAIGVLALPALAAWRGWLSSRLGAVGPPWIWLWVIAGLCLLASAHAIWGRETGLWGQQPAELLLTGWLTLFSGAAAWFLNLARLGAVGTRWTRSLGVLSLWLGLPAFAIAGALWVVDDHSPLAVLALSSAVMLGLLTLRSVDLFRNADRRVSRWALLPPVTAVVLLLVAAVGIAYKSLESEPDGTEIASVSVAGNRFDVWENPELFPNSGEQLHRAQAVLRGLPTLPALERPAQLRCDVVPSFALLGKNCREQGIPAVENDFVLAFWLSHTGRAGAGLLLLTQWGILLALGMVARRIGRTPGVVGDFVCLAVSGFAAALACHWIIGWSNPTGLLPVMGQSTTFLSAGNSHALFFGAPTLFLGCLAAALAALDRSGNAVG